MGEYASLRLEKEGGVATLTLNRPERHNAFDVPMAGELERAWQELKADPEVVCVIVTACFGWALGRMIEKLQLGAYDRLLGAAFGVAKAGLLCAGILLAVVYFAPNGGGIERSIGSSRSGPAIWQALDGAARYLPEGVRGDVEGFLRKNALPSPQETAAGGAE